MNSSDNAIEACGYNFFSIRSIAIELSDCWRAVASTIARAFAGNTRRYL
jgi:hypothetical protein